MLLPTPLTTSMVLQYTLFSDPAGQPCHCVASLPIPSWAAGSIPDSDDVSGRHMLKSTTSYLQATPRDALGNSCARLHHERLTVARRIAYKNRPMRCGMPTCSTSQGSEDILGPESEEPPSFHQSPGSRAWPAADEPCLSSS